MVAVLALAGIGSAGAQEVDAHRCRALAESMQGRWPDASTRVVSAVLRPQGPYTPPPMPGGLAPATLTLPEHCEVLGILHERIGAAGQHYAIRFHLRLPTRWNGRFFFQGGGGSNGVVGDALGPTASNAPPAIVQGFAVVSQDSGHDNAINSDPTRGGVLAFGFDAQARADYGHASLKVVADAAKAAVKLYYGKAPRFSYFVGCSKGGQEGMAFAQRYPEEFDGIVAAAPGFSLPRAAVAEAWDVQSIAALARSRDEHGDALGHFADAFSDADLRLVQDAILSACDADDGVKDGIVGNFMQCTDAKVRPAVEAKICSAEKSPDCLSKDQITALERVFAGPHDSAGHALYADWQWDAGIAGPGWRLWKLGSADHKIPALNIALGGASLAAVFTTPPTALAAEPRASANYQLIFSFDRDAAKIYATDVQFVHSAWDDIAARSSDLDRFRAHGGKLIVPHGVSDPVFSIHDTLAWYREVDARNHGHAERFVRVFPVPGMAHCGGGPATDLYDAFSALTEWVERGRAPDRILASAGMASPWPGRTRPLCPYPGAAHYDGSGDIEKADSFVCR
ncbi:MAG: tannase/feruloyl esterase family alpha/beta hydrolase [Steroidobacteraceae bacterium]